MTSTCTKCLIVASVIGLVIIAIILIAISLERLESYEAGVRYDVAGRKLDDSALQSGLYSGPPGFKFVKFPAVFKTINFESLECFSLDGAEVIINVQYQYKAIESAIPRIITLFKDHDRYLEVLELAGKSTLYKSCSKFNAYDTVADRASFANISAHLLQEKYKQYWAHINGLQINNIKRPDRYEEAQNNKEAMRENIQVKKNERPEKQTRAEIQLENAYADYTIAMQEAHRDARTTITKAEANAEAIRKEAEIEAQVYLQATGAGFDGDEAILRYISVNTIAGSNNPVQLGLASPANITSP